jgi:hypothetical protein
MVGGGIDVNLDNADVRVSRVLRNPVGRDKDVGNGGRHVSLLFGVAANSIMIMVAEEVE